MSKASLQKIAGATLILCTFALLAYSLLSGSIFAVGGRWVLAALMVAILILWWLHSLAPDFERSAAQAQILAAFFTVVAIVVAAGLYFLERRDQARLSIGLEVKVIRPTGGEAAVREVLLEARIPIENRGQRRVTIQCMGIHVMAPRPRTPLRRSKVTLEEVEFLPLRETIAYDTRATRECVAAEARRKKGKPGSFRPLFMWDEHIVEPDELDDLHFEIPISCEYPFVRVLWKARLRPADQMGYETKALVSLWDACRGEAGTSSAIVDPKVQTDATTAASGASMPTA